MTATRTAGPLAGIDLGHPVAAAGVCPRCHLDDRPIWERDNRALCASCWTRALPERALTFHGSPVPVTATQTTFLEASA